MKQILTLFTLTVFLTTFSWAQTTQLSGILQDAEYAPIEGVEVSVLSVRATTNAAGFFQLEIPGEVENFNVVFTKAGFGTMEKAVKANGKRIVSLGVVYMTAPDDSTPTEIDSEDDTTPVDLLTGEDRIPIITISDDGDNDLAAENISGILSASRDPFVAAAAFNLSTGGFDIRGYRNETTVLFNGMPYNNLENGRVFWSNWGGLNDVTRNRESSIDLSANSWTFGSIGGYTAFDTRASEQRKGARVSYMLANRAYTSRAMATWSSGMLPSGWAVSFSASKRWAEEGYVPGTFYDAYAYFASIDRKLGDKHLLNLTALGSPNRRGGQGSGVQELNDLAGTNFYNPNWGWQTGADGISRRKRNARVTDTHQPLFILRHDFNINEKSKLTTSVGYQTGFYGRTTLDWFKAPDPRADYYRKVPIFIELTNPERATELRQFLRDNPDELQIQWDDIYAGNIGNGKSWDGREGNWSQVILSDQRADPERINASTTFESILSDHFTLNGGVTFQQETTHYFKTAEDLLGGDYFVNVNRFVDAGLTSDQAKFDLESGDVIINEGDTHGWNYEIFGRRVGGWAQGQFSFRKVDAFVAGNITSTSFYREGFYRDGRFPDSSFGKSETQDYLNLGAKAGVTYKIDGRNYFYVNAALLNRAPDARIAYASPRSRDQLVPGLTEQRINAFEAGFQHRSPGLKARVTFFRSEIKDGLKLQRFFLPGDISNFGTYILNGLDERHVGIEAAGEVKLTSTLNAKFAASIGENIYTSRPEGFFIQDDDGVIRDRGTIYVKNFYVPSTPNTALSATLDYRSPKFWSASVSVNYFDRNYLDFSPSRRRPDAVFGLAEDSNLYNSIVDQQRVPDAFSVDLFAYKSWKISDGVFFSFTGGVTNLLNAEIVQGGYEQLRFELDDVQTTGINVFPARNFYAYGTNFFVLGALRF